MTTPDRNNGYVPPTRDGEPPRPTFTSVIGNPHNDHHVTTRVPVALAGADELNGGVEGHWWWAQVNPGGPEDKEHWSKFDGHQVRVGVDLKTWNEREVNNWKGRDEIRKAGQWTISFNEQVVYGGDFRDPIEALLTVRTTIKQLFELTLDWRDDDYRSQIEGRKVYYRDHPAVMGHWMPDQGCVMVKSVDGLFPPRAYSIDNDGSSDPFEDGEAKIELLSDRLWWWRDKVFPGDET